MGEVIQFPGRSQAAGEYRYRVYPAKVTRLPDDSYDPPPDAGWSDEQWMRWYLATVCLDCPLDIELRRSGPTGGSYWLRVGSRRPITNLTHRRVWDILGGVHVAATQLGVLTDGQ